MSIFRIGIEDLVANAFIELLRAGYKDRFISYKLVEDYGKIVCNKINSTGKEANMWVWRNKSDQMLERYSDFFEEKSQDGKLGVYLKLEITVSMLVEKFRGYLSLCVLNAFMDKKSVDVLKKGKLYE